MVHQDPAPNPAMEEALRLYQSGDPAAAEGVVAHAAEEAKANFGIDSQQYASAANDLGTILLVTGQTAQAVEALRAACQFDFPEDEQATRERLTFLMNLGHALQMADQFEEAEAVLREGLRGRAGFYGREHPGYAFGLIPLTRILLAQGRAEDALPVAEEAVENFLTNTHPWITKALALRAEAMKASGNPDPPFDEVEERSDELLHDLASEVVDRAAEANPRVLRRVLDDLLALLSARLGDTDSWTLNVLATIANLERDLGDHAAREQAIRRSIAALDTLGDAERALAAVQGLALALSDAGEPGRAEEMYREALRRAQALGDLGVLSQVKRNFGLFLRDQDQANQAEAYLREAVADGQAAGDQEKTALAEIALGIFVQHAGRLDEAHDLLARAIPTLDPAHPHALMGRSHLQAIESGGSCGCGDMRGSIAEAFAEFFRSQLPEDLIADIQVGVSDKDLDVKVQLTREPTEEEMGMLERAHRHAYEQFRKRIAEES